MKGFRQHLRSNLVGYLALTIAVIGVPTAWAALGKNTVGSAQLKKGSVKSAKIADDAVTSAKVADGSLRAADFGAGQLPAGPQGPEGPKGPQGPEGPEGPQGPSGDGMRGQAWVDNDEPPSFEEPIPVRGFTAVEREVTGVYCLTPTAALDVTVDPPIVTIEYSSSSGENFTAMWDQHGDECPDDEQYQINTYDADTGAATNGASFVIMVP